MVRKTDADFRRRPDRDLAETYRSGEIVAIYDVGSENVGAAPIRYWLPSTAFNPFGMICCPLVGQTVRTCAPSHRGCEFYGTSEAARRIKFTKRRRLA